MYIQKSQKNEVFVDLLERLTAVVAANVSHVMSSEWIILCLGKYHSSSVRWLHSNEKFFSWITRYVTMTTIDYHDVSTKLLEIKFALNEDLVVGQEASHRSMCIK